MMKGIKFDNIHSFYDLNLILSAVNIPPATVKTNFVNIPGADGSLDLTEALGKVNYNTRTCTFTFSVLPEDDFEEKKMEVSNALNGLRFHIFLDKDPGYYWDGRCSVNSYQSQKKLRKIVVGAVVAPYKLKKDVTCIPVTLTNAAQEVTLKNGRLPVCPEIICTGTAKIAVGDDEFNVGTGTHKILDFQLKQGKTVVTVSGSGTVEFRYQEGDL